MRIINNRDPFVPLYRKNEAKIQMSLQAGRYSEISKNVPFLHRGLSSLLGLYLLKGCLVVCVRGC